MPPLLRLPVVMLAALLAGGAALGPRRTAPEAAPEPAPSVGPTDAFGDPLPPGAVARLGTVRFRSPTGFGWHLALSPDAKLVVSAHDGELRVWDAATGRLTRTIPTPTFRAKSRHFYDGERVTSEGVAAMAFARPSGRLHVMMDEGVLRACDLGAGTWSEPLARSSLPELDVFDRGRVRAFASEDGTHFAYTRSAQPYDFALENAEVFALGRDRPLSALDRAKLAGLWLSFSPSNVLIGTARDGPTPSIHWDLAGGGPVTTLTGPGPGFVLINFVLHPNGRDLVAAFAPGRGDTIERGGWQLVVYDRATGAERRRVADWPEAVLGFSRSGTKLYSQSYHPPFIGVADALTLEVTNRLETAARGHLSGAAFSADRKRLATSTGNGHSIVVWDLVSEKPVPHLDAPQGQVSSIAFSPDGETVFTTTSEERSGWLWDARTGAVKRKLVTDTPGLPQVAAFAPDGRHLVAGYGFGGSTGHRERFEAVLWDAADGRPVRAFGGHTNGVQSLAVSPDGKHLVTRGGRENDTACLWELGTGKLLREPKWVPYHQSPQFVWPTDGELFGLAVSRLTGHKEFVNLWTGKVIGQWKVPHQAYLHALSPDGRTAVTREGWDGPRDLFTLREARTGRELRRLPVPRYWSLVAFSPDGKVVAVGEDNYRGTGARVGLYDVGTGAHLRTVGPHPGRATALAFSPDGTRLATGGSDTTVLIWDLTTKP